MVFISGTHRQLLESYAQLGYCNPFLPDRMRLERAVLGSEFKEGEAVWSYRAEEPQPRENIGRLQRRVGPALETVRSRLKGREGSEPAPRDLVPL